MSVVYLLVGRGGSRGVPGKNLKRIGGASLIDWKISSARAADENAYIVCSSDSAEIRDEAKRCGANDVIVRPAELATDTATTADVVKHAMGCIGDEWDAVMLLEPSAPFTSPDEYAEAIRMFSERDAELVVGMKESTPHTAFIGDVRDDESVTPIVVQFQRMARRRQDYGRQWTMSGGLYLFSREMFMATGDIYGGSRNYGLMQTRYTGLEIDTPEDLELAKWYFARDKVRLPYRGNLRPWAMVGA